MKKWIILLSCVAILVLAVLGGWMAWQHTSFQKRPFGYYYGVSTVFFSVWEVEPYSVEIPKYALSDTGKLMEVNGESTKRLTGSMKQLALTEENFDACFHESGDWRTTGISAASARKLNVQAWQYQAMDGSFYYVLLQRSGDTFICIGDNGKICQFIWVQPLMKY